MLKPSRSSVRHTDGSRPVQPGIGVLEAGVLREEEADLAGLSWNWDGAYTFALSDDGIWTAKAVGDPATVLTADSADELRKLVRADYVGRQPVPRTPATSYLQERMST